MIYIKIKVKNGFETGKGLPKQHEHVRLAARRNDRENIFVSDTKRTFNLLNGMFEMETRARLS